MIRKEKICPQKGNYVNIGAMGFARTKIVRTFIFKKTVKIILTATNAGIKGVKRGTEKHAGIGTLMVVTEMNTVPTFTNIHVDQGEDTRMRVEAKAIPTEEDHIPD